MQINSFLCFKSNVSIQGFLIWLRWSWKNIQKFVSDHISVNWNVSLVLYMMIHSFSYDCLTFLSFRLQIVFLNFISSESGLNMLKMRFKTCSRNICSRIKRWKMCRKRTWFRHIPFHYLTFLLFEFFNVPHSKLVKFIDTIATVLVIIIAT